MTCQQRGGASALAAVLAAALTRNHSPPSYRRKTFGGAVSLMLRIKATPVWFAVAVLARKNGWRLPVMHCVVWLTADSFCCHWCVWGAAPSTGRC